MSSKANSKARGEEAKPALLPKLRFTEFQSAGAWTTETLGSVARICTEKVGENTCIPMSITSGIGLVSQIEKFGRVIAGSSYSNYLLLKKNDFAYNKSATKEYPEGFIALYTGTELAAVPNSIFTCFRINGASPDPEYLNYLFLTNLHGEWLRKFIEVGARAHGSLSINNRDLLAMPIPLPGGKHSLREQRKVASCLSSLDNLITAHTQKLAALKAYKKGLMQQLFPREGENVPRLRFPEFRGGGAWEAIRLGDEGDFLSSLTGKTGADFDTGEARFITYMNVFTNTFIDPKQLRFVDVKAGENQNAVVSGDIFFTISSETPDEVGMSSVLLEDLDNCYLNSFCALFRFSDRKRLNPIFAGYLLRQPSVRAHFKRRAQGSTRYNLSKDAFRSLPICVPSAPEQQSIAFCLGALDDLIAAQTQKLLALKTHKKGLMQGLFPTTEETEA